MKEVNAMRISFALIPFGLIIYILIFGCILYLLFLLAKALRVYIKSKEVRKEKAINARSLGEIIKEHRTACNMTQEFVAEAVGVSRQAVSKWESGVSDASTTNLMALANLFGISPEEVLKELSA